MPCTRMAIPLRSIATGEGHVMCMKIEEHYEIRMEKKRKKNLLATE